MNLPLDLFIKFYTQGNVYSNKTFYLNTHYSSSYYSKYKNYDSKYIADGAIIDKNLDYILKL